MELLNIVKEIIENLIAKDVSYISKKFEYADEEFCIGYGNRRQEINVWVNGGSISLYGEENVSSVEIIAQTVTDVINGWLNGYIYCSDCGARIKKSEIAGGYFAGVYCKKCWDNKWREIEAKETYD